MFADGAPALLLVSGGGDSVALLTLFARGSFGERPVRVLHVNHLLRGAAADADEAFVVDLCEQLGVACRVVRYDVAAYAREAGLNLEDAGRRVRYRFADEELDALCDEVGAPRYAGRIATGHTRDDRIETFVMRAASGAGPGALASIRATRGRIVRPLIECDRAELRAYLERAGIAWREDATNMDTARARALIRHEVVPALERLNPAFRGPLARTLDLLADDDELLSRMAEGFARDFTEVRAGEVRFDRQLMRTLERTMARRTVRSALALAFPDIARIEAEHIEALVDGLAADSFARDLPGGLTARCEYDTLIVSRRGTGEPALTPSVLPLPGRAELGPAGEIVAEEAASDDVSGSADSVVIDAGLVRGELVVDAVREGDRMRPLGLEGTKKLSDLLIDAKVPRAKRRLHPVVRDGERIVWLAGVRMSDEYKVTPATRRAMRLTWSRRGSASAEDDA